MTTREAEITPENMPSEKFIQKIKAAIQSCD